MEGKMVLWCMSVLVFYFMRADGYVVEANLPEENNSVEKQKNVTGVDILFGLMGLENFYNWNNLATPSQANSDTICDLTDRAYKLFKNSCYKVHTEEATWPVAESTCIREGGQLAVINSRDEARVLVRQYPRGFRVVHIGVIQIQYSWMTVDGKTLREAGYEIWDEGKPNNIAGDEYCGAMYPDGSFDDISCSEETAFICEKAPISQPQPASMSEPQSATESDNETSAKDYPVAELNESKCVTMATLGTGYTFFESTRSCYKVHTDRATWDDAEATCVREGGHLAVINSQDEADILTTLYPEGAEHVFVGFSYRDLWGSSKVLYEHRRNGEWTQCAGWRTTDGERLSMAGYENWSPGEPNNAGGREYCGTMYGNGKFDDADCDEEFDFICEIKPRI